MNGKVIAAKLHSVENGILGVEKNPEIQEILTTFGYTPERMKEGKGLLNKVQQLTSSQVEDYGEQFVATSEQEKLRKTSYADYMVTLKVARVAFVGQPEQLKKFGATGKRSKSLSGWLRDARVFYTNLLNSPDALAVLAQFGYSAEKLEKELQTVNAVEDLHNKQLKEKGEAQQSTLERDKVFDELCKWFCSFRSIARIALYHKPQLLETLGIVKS
jgi:hypothetical protein